MCFRYIASLCLFNHHRGIRINFYFIYLYRMTQPFFTCHCVCGTRDFGFHDVNDHLIPLILIVYSQIKLNQVLFWINSPFIFNIVRHEVISKQICIIINILIRCPRVPFSVAGAPKSHFCAIFPSHFYLVSAAHELLIE